MQRFFIALFLMLGLLGIAQDSRAQQYKEVSGWLNAGQTRVFKSRTPGNSLTDTIYRISGRYMVAGRLVIEEGAEVHFLPDGRLIDSAGGKIIANGFAGLGRRIQMRGVHVSGFSDEWGHIVILPGADSAFFANVRFAYFRKRDQVDRTLHYGTVGTPLANSLAIIKASNGTGGVMTTFSRRTYLYDVIADSCTSMYRGGAFAFLQSPAQSYFPNDDGRLALRDGQVRRLLVRDCKVINDNPSPNTSLWADTAAFGGAIFMSSRDNAGTSDFVAGRLGYLDSNGFGTGGVPTPTKLNLPTFTFHASADTMQFERCEAINLNDTMMTAPTVDYPVPQDMVTQPARGGAIYVGDYTGLTLHLATFNTNNAIAKYDRHSRGGAVYVSSTSADPNSNYTPPALSNPNSRLPGLAVMKRARFNGNTAGNGGAIHLDYRANGSVTTNGPMLNIDGDNIIETFPFVRRDSGRIEFVNNTAYRYGGAIYNNWYTYITGYLAPQTHVFPRWDSVELRVNFQNNAAGLGGGSVYLNPDANPDYQVRRTRHAANFVDPMHTRINRPEYKNFVIGGGAELLGTRDSAFAVEYLRNYVIGGNGGAVHFNMAQSGPGAFAYNRYFGENNYNASDPRLSPLPYDQRELTRFVDNWATTGEDSVATHGRTGRGGGLYVEVDNSSAYPVIVKDTLILSRVRFEDNQAFTGSAIHSDNYYLHLNANQTLVANNTATSRHSAVVDLETPNMNNPADQNAGAAIWADFEGATPFHESNSRGNAIYDNNGRYIIRLPDGPAGFGGVDTVRGNFWGETGADVITKLPPLPLGASQSTFFIDYYDSCIYNVYEPRRAESYTYSQIPIGVIEDTLLFEGRIYDIFDRGKDIKTLDYSDRRLAIAEAFSLGLPTDVGLASNGRRGMHRWTRDIFQKDPVYLDKMIDYQTEFVGPHPIGYPLFLQADIDGNDLNRDAFARNYTVVFVLNQNTQEYVRVNLKEEFQNRQDSATIPYRGRIDFVPDSTVAQRNPAQRARVFWSPTLIRPSNSSYEEIARAAKLEDSAALRGRYYQMTAAEVLNNTSGASDSICYYNTDAAAQTEWYAGELYNALPVRPGDNIAVFSRTQLWKYGFAGAVARGLSFQIGDVLPPFYAGDIPALQSDPVNPNRKFVREDVNYLAYQPTYASGDSILIRIAGYDMNFFYNPAWLFDPFNYTQLDIAVTFGEQDSLNSRLPWWIQRDTAFNQNPGVGSNGYVQLYGTPHNPDVVPSGEPVHVELTNWPPNYASEHQLLDNFDAVLGADSNKLSHWLNPRYFNVNNEACGRGFQLDTLCVRRTSRIYDFRIYVMDSLPLFLTTPDVACAANLTDSLRYDYDINTDDEIEDDSVARVTTEAGYPWDFRFGRTSYNLNTAPLWLKNYFANRPIEANTFNASGIMNIRMPASEVYPLITPVPQVNGELLLDTLVGVEADDGHMGKRTQQWRLPINVEPTITTTSLPTAKEDFEYSTYFNDENNIPRIEITDPNFGDFHTFRLVYEGETDSVYRDNRFKTGLTVVEGKTPLWLSINPTSGVLYGTPGINDAPRLPGDPCGGPETVTIVVEDVCGLTAWKELELNVDSTHHLPEFFRASRTICVRNKTPFCDTLRVADRDLLRECPTDTLWLNVLEPAGFTASPAMIPGQQATDTHFVAICGQFNEDDQYFVNEPLAPRYISVEVRDAQGHVDQVRYRVHVGDIPTFECAIYVSNKLTTTHPVDVQMLCFGAGKAGTDSLDIRYCEIEVPPPGPASVFDGRWELPIGGSLKGTVLDIRRDTNQYSLVTWQIRFQSGQEQGSFLYPVELCWNKACLDSTGTFQGHFYLQHPNTPEEFSINMRDGVGPYNPSFYSLRAVGSDSFCLEIKNIGLGNARIVFVPNAILDVPTGTPALATGLEFNAPNPFVSSTTLRFNVAERSNVRIDIYDVKGALVRTLVNEMIDAGTYPVVWDATSDNGTLMPSGTYVAKMIADGKVTSIKMTLQK